jgi:hypothetical protein
MKEQVSCRKARREMHDALDRAGPIFPADSEDLTRFLPGEVRAHLERCPRCKVFLLSLGTFAPVLRSQLDEALQDYSAPEFATVPREKTGNNAQFLSLQKHRGAATAAALRRLRNWLFGTAGKPARAYRWIAVSAIEQQIDRIVELIYGEPLLPGIESALLRTQPTISDYVEDMNRTVDIWLEESDPQSYLN